MQAMSDERLAEVREDNIVRRASDMMFREYASLSKGKHRTNLEETCCSGIIDELLNEVERLRGENAKFRELFNKAVADACGEVGG